MLSINRRIASAIAVLSLAATAACSSSAGEEGGSSTSATPVRGGTLNMLGSGDVDYMDPNISYYAIGYLGLRMWSRQLFTFPAEPGKVTTAVPDIATEIPTMQNGGISQDGLTYTIHMRDGVKWNTSPARAVTAGDEVRGVKRTCNPVQPFGGIPDFASLIEGYQQFCDGFAKAGDTPQALAQYMDSHEISGVQAKDDHTVVFKLTQPASYFVDMLTMAAFSPAPKEFESYLPASAQLAQHTVSDGPYQVASYDPTKQIVFTRNPAWTASSDPVRKAYVDKIVVDETITQESAQQQLQTGTDTADMEWNDFPPPSQIPQLQAAKDPNLQIGETSQSNPYIVFNTISPNNNNALQKVQVRQALEYGLNRQHLIQVLGGPATQRPLTHVLPSNIVGSQDIDLYPYNPQKAKQLLAQAGYPNGLTLKFLYRSSSEGSTKAFQVAQQDLSKIGVHVQGVASPDADFYTKYMEVPDVAKRGVWDLSLAGWGADWFGNSAVSYFAPLFSGKPSFPPIGSNYGFYDSAKANALIHQASTATSEDQVKALWAKADRQVMADAAFFPITNSLQPDYHASQVHNAVYLPVFQDFDPTNVWLESGHQGG